MGLPAFCEAVAEAGGNPDAAQALFDKLLYRRKDASAIQETYAQLQELGVPLGFLSHKEGKPFA